MGGGASTPSKSEAPKTRTNARKPVTDSQSPSAKLFPMVNTEVGKLNDCVIVQKELPNGRSYRVKQKPADQIQDGVTFVETGPLSDRVTEAPPSQLPLKARGSQHQMARQSPEREAARMAADQAEALAVELGDPENASPTVALSEKQEQTIEVSPSPVPKQK